MLERIRLCSRKSPSKNSRKIRGRRFLTLLELLLVIAVLGMAAGFIGINIRRAVAEQRFKTEVAAVVENLRLAQDLMLILNTDAKVRFASDKGSKGIYYRLMLEEPPENLWVKEVQRVRKPLTAIHNVEFLDETPGIVDVNSLDVRFGKGGFLMSKGIMRLSESSEINPPKGSLERFICLPGYPRPIVSAASRAEALCDKEQESAMLERITLFTAAEIQEKGIKKNKNVTNEVDKPQPSDPEPGRNKPSAPKKSLPSIF